MPTQIAVIGATGRLGSQVVEVVDAMPEWEVVAHLDSTSDLTEMLGADIAVDATNPGVSQSVVEFGVRNGIKMLVGTSGWSAEKIRALTPLVAQTGGSAVYIVPNFSLGATMQGLVAMTLAEHFDSIEIVEAHHVGKADSPSGTAVRAAEEIARVRALHGGVIAPHVNQSARGEQVQGIPVHSLRLSGIVARQDIFFGGVGETITLTHETHSRDAYQAGITLALAYLASSKGITVGLEHAVRAATS
jgi:4-hydroxy-tetrahydrodipicolinate reductase